MLAEAATCVPALTPVVAKCDGKRPAPVLFQMNSAEWHKMECSSGEQQGDAMGPALFCLLRLPVLKGTREEFESKVVESFDYLDISIGMVEVTSNTVEVVTLLQRELISIGIDINPTKTVVLSPKGHVPTLQEIVLLEGVGVHVGERGGVKVVGVPIGTDEYAMESAVKIVENSAEHLAWMPPHMPDKQSANLIPIGSMVQRTGKPA